MDIESLLSPLATNYWFTNLETLYLLALRGKDIATLGEMTDDRFIGVGILGLPYGKEEMLRLIETTATYEMMDLIDVTVIRETGFAITISEVNAKFWFNRVYTSGLIRITRVWVERPTGWKILSYQVIGAQKAESWRAALEKFSIKDK
jgi:hypothetical protein